MQNLFVNVCVCVCVRVHIESLLHVCVRLGFVSVSEFLLCQPGALMTIRSANQDEDTPLQLAQQTNQHTLIKLFKE